jgi:hypothetical protein
LAAKSWRDRIEFAIMMMLAKIMTRPKITANMLLKERPLVGKRAL